MNLKSLSGNKSRRVSDGENDYEDYKQKLAAFLPTINAKDVDSYYDDLYLRVTPESTAFIKSLPQPTYKVGGWRVSIFVDNIEKDRWYEIKIGNPYGDLRGRDSRTDFSQICKGGSISDSRRVSDERRIKDDAIEDYIKTLVAEIITTEDYGISERFPMKDNYPEGSVRKLESFIASVKNYSEATNTTPVIIPQTDYYRIVFGDANNETLGEIFYIIKQLPTDKLTNDMENLISIS